MNTPNRESLKELLLQILSISSPTYHEQQMNSFLTSWLTERVGEVNLLKCDDSFIVQLPEDPNRANKPHICLVGHTDTVPEYFDPYEKEGRLYGSGASDMKGALPVFLKVFEEYSQNPNACPYELSLIFYACEEGTPLHENGMKHLRDGQKEFLSSVDLAIIGEPTDRTIQIGCVGSIHATVRIPGREAHSARPWNGENALYNALPFVTYFSNLQRVPCEVGGVTFYDVLSITENCGVTPGKTTIPGEWQCNVNYRFSPDKTLDEALSLLDTHLLAAGAEKTWYEISSAVYAGKIVEGELLTKVIDDLGLPLQAKQAWTDVAQFGEEGIAAFNYGPGLTSQAHKKDEFLELNDLYDYYERLNALLFRG